MKEDKEGKKILRNGTSNFETVNGKKTNHHNSKMEQKIK